MTLSPWDLDSLVHEGIWPGRAAGPADGDGHGPAGESAAGEPAEFEGAESDYVVIPCKNYESRRGARVRLGVLHTAEGALTVTELGNYFRSTTRAVSSHMGADAAGRLGRFVPYDQAAWTNPDLNAVSDTLEMCAFAAYSRADWLARPALLTVAAQWMVDRHLTRGLPLTWLTPEQVNAGAAGFIDHHVVTIARNRIGGHTDCGPNFPRDVILARATALLASKQVPAAATLPAIPIIGRTFHGSKVIAYPGPNVRILTAGQLPVLGFGDRDEALGGCVTYLQHKLGLVANGYFGASTGERLRVLQRSRGLHPTGTTDRQATWPALGHPNT